MNSIEKLNAPTIAQFHKQDSDDPLVYAAYYRTTIEGSIEGEPFTDDCYIVGYVLAIDGGRAWVRAYSEITPEGEEGTEDIAALSPIYVAEDGLDWEVPLIGGLNTGAPFRVSLVSPPEPLSKVTRDLFHTGRAGAVGHPSYRGFNAFE
jgi:hypothetical protein